MRRSTRCSGMAIVAIVGAIVFGACNNTTPVTPTTTPAPTTTDPFTGTLTPNSARIFPFTVQAAGTLTATLTTITPDSTIAVGLDLGTWNGSACQIIIANTNVVQSGFVTGAAGGLGTLCVRIYDVGNLTANEDFVVTVVHP